MRRLPSVRRAAGAVAALAAAGWIAAASPAVAQELPAPAVRAGRADAPARFEVFCNLEMIACGALIRTLGHVFDDRPDTVSIVYHQITLPGEPELSPAYRAALAAARQDRGWEMLDMLYANPDQREAAQFGAMAARLGLDTEQFSRDVEDPALARVVEADQAEASRLQAGEAPALFLNGVRYLGALSYEAIAKAAGQK